MRMITGGFSLEHEDLGSVNYPKQRFADPVRVGIFFFGFPPEGEETFPATRAEEKEDRATGLTTDIYFEGGPPMSREIKSPPLPDFTATWGTRQSRKSSEFLQQQANLTQRSCQDLMP